MDHKDQIPPEVAASQCEHPELETETEANPYSKVEGGGISTHEVAIRVRCAICKTPFHFVGLDQGASYRRPMAGQGAVELLAPVAPGPGPMTHQIFETAPENFLAMLAEDDERERVQSGPGGSVQGTVISQDEATRNLPPSEVSDAEFERRAAEELTRDERENP